MYRLIIISLLLLYTPRIFASVKTVAIVNEELISSLDIEKRISSMEYLGIKIDQEQALQSLIDETLIEDQAKELKVFISGDELSNEIPFFFKRFKLSYDEFIKQVKKSGVGYDSILKHIKSRLLWDKISELKILSFINISNEEVNNVKQQIDRVSAIINVLEILIPNKSKSTDSYDTAFDITRKLRNNEDLETILKNNAELPVSIRTEALNIMQLPSRLQKVLENLNISDVSNPIAVDDAYLVIKVINRVKFDSSLMDVTLNLKQIYLPNGQENFNEHYKALDILKNQKISCLTLNETAENLGLPKIEEIEVKMRELAPYIQASLQELQVGKIIDTKDNKGNLRLIVLCNIRKKYINQHEWIKQKIFEQKVSIQSAIYLDNMRKNATIRYGDLL